ncbi:type II toxin-antitoxin system HicA family toxin [Candidatus Parcubacteria bacterium]|nr:type II toxin-antitoxin system HicA family toxin [Candidatus Parcubacteria bacterium]
MFRPISRRDLIKKLQLLGFIGPYSGGNHQFMRKGNFKIFIPNPHKKDIGKILLSRITKELGISMNDFLDLK